MKIKDFINKYENEVPLYLQDDWDNSGFQIGDVNSELKGILITLDFSLEAVEYAIKNSLNLIFTHHPLFFSTVKNIDFNTKKGNAIRLLINNNITVYSSHTNLDYIEKGVSNALSEKISLQTIGPIIAKNENNSIGLGKVGIINSTSAVDFICDLKKILNEDKIIVYGNIEKDISKIGLIGGSGASAIDTVINMNIDILITSDIKYHDAEHAVENNLILVDLGHYVSEKFIIDILFKKFSKEYNILIEKFYFDKSQRNIL